MLMWKIKFHMQIGFRHQIQRKLRLVEEKKEYARQNMKKVLNDDYVVRICVDNDFDSVKIDKILDTFKTDVRV